MTDQRTEKFCRCGCGEPVSATATWAPGHDSIYLETMTKRALGAEATRLTLIDHLETLAWSTGEGIPRLESPTSLVDLFDLVTAQSARIAELEGFDAGAQRELTAHEATIRELRGRIDNILVQLADTEPLEAIASLMRLELDQHNRAGAERLETVDLRLGELERVNNLI